MFRCLAIFCILFLVISCGLGVEPPDDWVHRIKNGQLLWAAEEPSDPAFMPAIANGNLATVVGSNASYIAGVYNGFLDGNITSHRAAVPVCPAFTVTNGELFACALDVENGAYYRRLNVGNGSVVEQVWYAHSAFPQLLVHAIRFLNGSNGTVALEISNACSDNTATPDFNLTMLENSTLMMVAAGSTLSAETPDAELVRVGLAFQYAPQQQVLAAGRDALFLIVVHSSLENVSAGSPEAMAQEDLLAFSNMTAEQLWKSHTASWQQLMSSRIEVEGNEYLAAAINASHYALLSNLNSSVVHGISPGGIATNAYNGHVFWDSETWMYPPQLLLHPSLAKSLLQYRVDRVGAAAAKAQSFGFAGLMFPWESSATGVDTCPWALGLQYEHHISGDISFAMQQYWRATGDVAWLRSAAWPVVSGVADFWASRAQLVQLNSTAVEYVIDSVIPPDEHAGVVNNSVYTNAIAAISLRWAIQVAQILNESVPENYSAIAAALRMPFDADSQRHLEYDNYVNDSIINQADVALLQYPLGLNFSYSIAVNDLAYWQNVTDPNGYFTGDSAYSIAWLRLGNQEQAFEQFNKSFAHLQPPFNVWNERVVGGHPHFITGAGGFLQSVLFGYGGLRLTDSALLIVNPLLPMKAHAIVFRNIHYMGATFTIRYNADSMTVQQTSNPPPQTPPVYFLLVAPGGERWGLGIDWKVEVGTGNASIVTSSKPGARPPNWYIIMLILGGVLGVLGVVTLLTLVVRTVAASDRTGYEQLHA